ncbi:MAG: PEGA domain-containing protein [Candidatus Cloacimonetes bacterium]|nr:PEGA domain-containing protein [Candidatus Cloacimonadota bacterium]
MKRVCVAIFLFSLLFVNALEFSQIEFREVASDFTAQRKPVMDLDMKYCSMLKVELLKPANVTLKQRVYKAEKTNNGMAFYFASSEAVLTVTAPGYVPFTIAAPGGGFKPGAVYYLRLDAKSDTFVTIRCTPAAPIMVDGKDWLLYGNRLSVGSHQLRIEKEGYQTIEETISVGEAETVFQYQLNPEQTVAADVPVSAALPTVITVDGSHGLRGEYYNLPPWEDDEGPRTVPSGTPIFTQIDPTITFHWGDRSPAPNVSSDYFYIRWTGKIEIPVDGTYRFALGGYNQGTWKGHDKQYWGWRWKDDGFLGKDTGVGFRLYVNGAPVLSEWKHGDNWEEEKVTGEIFLNGGQRYDIKLEVFDKTGAAHCYLMWIPPGKSEYEFVPETVLTPQ